MSLEYFKGYWVHDLATEPSMFLYEVNGDHFVRVIEIWADGSLKYADGPDERGGAGFPQTGWTPKDWDFDEAEDGLAIRNLSKSEFETAWQFAQDRKN